MRITRSGGAAIVLASAASLLLWPWSVANAGFTETLPSGTVLTDESYLQSEVNHAYDNSGARGPLIDPIIRYEPGGSQQGIITPNAQVHYQILLSQIQAGIFDDLSAVVAIPLVLENTVDPKLKWTPGDYQWTLGRPYSEDDFWAWAASMGQPKPGDWRGNEGVLSDIVIGTRYRFSRWIEWLEQNDLATAFTIYGALPTGKPPDPEEIVAAGTTTWDLHSQGDLGFHLGVDKFFKESLDDRVTLGLNLFYEILLPHEYVTPRGTKNPLLLNYAPYVGSHYTVDPGDFAGVSLQIDTVPWKGPAWASWVSQGSTERAAGFPPIVTVSFRYTFTYLQQSNWESKSDLWDWDREKLWRPGYKNILNISLLVSLLRLGIPAQPYIAYRNQSLIPGKNARAANVLAFGIRVPVRLW